MTLTLEAPTIPLRLDKGGTIRVGNTRVRLDTVVYAFNQGLTAEEIAANYPSLQLADVYATIAYYLNHKTAVDEYIRCREIEAEEIWQEIEQQPGYQTFRERLLARSKTKLTNKDVSQFS